MKILCYRNRLDGHDEMSITYYLLLQDRIAEAAQHFATVEPEHLATRLQHDYFAAYFDCFNVDPQRAAAIAAEYADFPVDRWRHAFANVANIVEELRSGATRTVDP